MSRARSRDRRSGGSAWSPASLGAALWYEADSVVQSAGVLDRTLNLGTLGSALDSVQSTVPSKPAWSATGGPNNNPAVIHTSPRYLLTPHDAGWKTAQITWWVLLKYDADTGQWQSVFNSADDISWTKGFCVVKNNATSGNTDTNVATTGYATNAVTFVALGTTGWHLLIGRYDGTQVLGTHNGVAGTPDPFAGPIVHGTGPLVIGSSIQTVTPTYAFNWLGRWASIGVVPRCIDDAECARLKAWIESKWIGGTLS